MLGLRPASSLTMEIKEESDFRFPEEISIFFSLSGTNAFQRVQILIETTLKSINNFLTPSKLLA